MKCEGLEIYGLDLTKTAGRQQDQIKPLLETQEFVPYDADSVCTNSSFQKSLTIALEIILQNCYGFVRKLSICEILIEDSNTEGIMSYVSEILSKKPFVTPSFIKSDPTKINGKYDVIIFTGTIHSSYLENLEENGFIICQTTSEIREKIPLDIIYQSNTSLGRLLLLRKPTIIPKEQLIILDIQNEDLNWLEDLKSYMRDENPKNVFLVSQCDRLSGIIGLTNCLNKEPSSCKFKFVFTDEIFSINEDFYKNQLKKNLIFNILRDRKWGTYIHLPLEKITEREVNNAAVQIRTVGNLASLEWVQIPQIYNG